MNPKIPATAAMLVKNSERYLHEVLTALQDFDEVLLLDNGSTDRTFEIAERFTNVSYYKYDFIGFGPMKNLAARLAQNNWIFSIDSDEVADSELIAAIRKAVAENKEQNIFSLSRLNHYNGRLIKACGWYPDIIPRLYHRRFTRFSDRQVHESLILPPDANVRPLEGRLKHYSFENAEGLIQKMQQYSSLYAEENRYKKDSSPFKALLHGSVSFVKNYLLKRGFAYGADGLTISIANAQGSYYKYVKLYERNRNISVALIITTYNRPDALELVLKSALAQTRLPDDRLLYEAYGDIGGSIEEALSANWDNFEKSGLNVMLDAFNQTGGAETWTLDGLPFTAYIGRPTLKFAGGKPQCPTEPLIGAVKEALKRTRISNAIHFVRFYYCQINGEAESVEFMLDNQNLPFAEQALARLDWPKREAFYSLRLFFILIPEKAV